jgi:hypothetical protein
MPKALSKLLGILDDTRRSKRCSTLLNARDAA